MVTADKVFNLVETQGPLVAKIGRNALSIYDAVKDKQFFAIFTLGQTLVDDVTKLVAVAKAELEPVAMKSFVRDIDKPARFVEPLPLPEFRCCNDPLDCNQPCSMKSAAPVGGLAFGKGPGHRLFARYVRSKVKDKLRAEGFASVGGSSAGMSMGQIDELLSHLDDNTILNAGQEVGAIGDGRILQGLQNLLDWLLSNSDKIARLVQFLISLLAAF